MYFKQNLELQNSSIFRAWAETKGVKNQKHQQLEADFKKVKVIYNRKMHFHDMIASKNEIEASEQLK